MIGVFSVVGAVFSALVGSIFASAFVGHAVLLSKMMGLVMDADLKTTGESLLKDPEVKNGFYRQLGSMTVQLWLTLLFYGSAVYLIWGV